MVRKIVNRGFNINARLVPHGSSLMLAIQQGHQNTVMLLIQKGADVNINIPAIGIDLYLAALYGREEIVKSLVFWRKADLDALGGEYGSALQAAVVSGHEIIVLHLLESGADVNPQGGKYGNALHAAIARRHYKLAELLLLSGARVVEKPKEEAEAELGVSRWRF